MDVQLSEEQRLLQASVREFLERECPMSFVREMMDDARGFTDGFWKQMGELGWTGLVLPERHGGAGLGPLDLAVVLEEMGQVLLPGPYFSTVALGGEAIARTGSEAQCERWVPGIAGGQLRATLALREPGGSWAPEAVRCLAERDGGDWRLSGHKTFVTDGHTADLVVVAAREERADGPLGLFVVASDADGLVARPVEYTDATRKVADVRLEGVRVADEARLSAGEPADASLAALLDRARVALVAEMCGGAQRVLDLSVAYAKQREQFGKPIGSFQAIQHRCADMLLQVENLRSAAWYASWCLGEDEPEAHAAASKAKAYASEAYPAVAGAGIQIHGGLGYTWEQDLHLYYKRAKADERALGDTAFCRELVARTL